MLFGNKTRVRPVPGGREIERYCPDCKTVRTFQECDVADNVSVFFVSVVDMNSRRMVCPECGEDEEMPPDADAKPPVAATRPPPAPAKPAATDSELEKLLADLKERMKK
jgi:hypothetical protein